ncbi:MAG: hypothetical protein QMD04_01660 [Anaerolineales bacterium]|nr:hypothetical protein [Anaerolineales bacterium]
MKTKISASILPRLQDVLFLSIFLAVLALGQRMINMDGDLPRHLLTGKLILQTGTIPTTELFVYPYEGRVYVSHEWLADIVFYLIYNYVGLAGIVILSAILLASTFSLLYASLASRLDIRIPVLFLVAWGAATTSLHWITRPHLFSMLLLAVWLVLTDRLARGEKIPLWYFPVIMVIWSNFHGEFIAGILVTAAYAAGWTWDYLFDREKIKLETGRRIWFGLLFSALASLINPAGFRPWIAMFSFVKSIYLMSRMYEANSPDFHQPQFLVLLGLLAFSIVLLSVKADKLSKGQAFLLAGFSAMSLMAARNIHLYGVVAPFVLSETTGAIAGSGLIEPLENILRRIENRLKGVVWPVITVLAIGAILIGGKAGPTYSFSPSFFPVDAVRWLESHPQEGRMFNNLDWGGYIAFYLWPQQTIFADSMADVTGELTQKFETVVTLADGWEEILGKYQVQLVIMPEDSELVRQLESQADWQVIYADSTTVILQRR